MSEALVMRIPREYGATVTHEWDGLVVSLPVPTEQDLNELGSAFVTLGVSLWQKERERRAAGESEQT